jgi:glycerate dehydrogenase
MDVVAKEPIPADSPLLSAPNCIITPHMAWAPKESRQRIMDCTQRSIDAFLAGNPINTVN